jgi:hypothetical protein
MRTGPTPGWQAAILAAVTVAVFLPTLSSGFVYDARLQILTDPFLHDPWNWLPVLSFGVLGMDVLDFNRPVHLASLMLDAAIWGRNPFGYHLTSVLLHALNVVLVWRVVSDVLGSGPASASPRSSQPCFSPCTPSSPRRSASRRFARISSPPRSRSGRS